MADQSGPQDRREHLLEEIARSTEQPGLFPPEVLRLFREGEARKARRALLRHAKDQRNDELAAKQREMASRLHLWREPLKRPPRMYTLNGVGTRLLGIYQQASDGTYVATLWFTFVFVPLWPIAAYVVLPAPEGGWHFLSRVPLPPTGERARRLSGSLGVLGALAIAAMVLWSGQHLDVYAFNGFDRPVYVTVGEQARSIEARQYALFEDVPAAETTVSAAWAPQSEPLESFPADLAGHGRDIAVYNVGGRAVLQVEVVTYGPRQPDEPRLLDAGPILFERAVDHPFEEPPDSVSVPDGGTAERSTLYAIDDGADVTAVVDFLAARGREGQARSVATAELLAHPENAELAYHTAITLLPDDLQAQVALLRSCIERAPDEVDLHRYYQELWPPDRQEEVRAEYEALLADNPRSAMHHYLVGRLAETRSTDALRHYDTALELDPEYPPAIRALGYRAMAMRRWVEAAGHYDRYASFGTAEMVEVLDERTRLRRRTGRPWAEVDALLAEALAVQEDALDLVGRRAHVRLFSGATDAEGAAAELLDGVEAVYGPDLGPIAHSLRADLLITSGDLSEARNELAQVTDPAELNPRVALRLALSDGAVPEDVERLESIAQWHEQLGDPGLMLMALLLLDEDERAELRSAFPDRLTPAVDHVYGPDLANADALEAIVAEVPVSLHAAVAFVAWRRARDAGVSAESARRYLEEARASALPHELPYLGR